MNTLDTVNRAAGRHPAQAGFPSPADSQESVIRRDDITALYEWRAGDCFRCAARATPTAAIGEITPPSGDTYVIRACATCVLAMEDECRRYAARRGLPYRPGNLGRRCP